VLSLRCYIRPSEIRSFDMLPGAISTMIQRIFLRRWTEVGRRFGTYACNGITGVH